MPSLLTQDQINRMTPEQKQREIARIQEILASRQAGGINAAPVTTQQVQPEAQPVQQTQSTSTAPVNTFLQNLGRNVGPTLQRVGKGVGVGLLSALESLPDVVYDRPIQKTSFEKREEEERARRLQQQRFLEQEQLRNIVDPRRALAQKQMEALQKRFSPDVESEIADTGITPATEGQQFQDIVPAQEGAISPRQAEQAIPIEKGVQVDTKTPSKYIEVKKWKTDQYGSRKVPETVINPDYAKYLSTKEFRTKEEDKLLFKARQDQELNNRNFEAMSGLFQQTVASWKAAMEEKRGKIAPGFIAKKTGPVAESLGLPGLSYTKAYMGQKIETAMMLSKIITGGSRIVKSVLNKIMETLPEDDMLEKDMQAKITQSFFNTYTRATGRRLSEEERQQVYQQVQQVLDTPPMQLPSEALAQADQPQFKKLRVDGMDYEIPLDKVMEFIKDQDEDSDIQDLS